MFQVCISSRVLNSLSPQSKPYFIKDSNVKGFAVKVNPSGSIKYIAEVKYRGRSKRKTIGEYPLISPSDARTEALAFPSKVKLGQAVVISKQKTLQKVLDSYLSVNQRGIMSLLYEESASCWPVEYP